MSHKLFENNLFILFVFTLKKGIFYDYIPSGLVLSRPPIKQCLPD